MRSTLRSLLPLALLAAGCSWKSDEDANERRVTIFFTTDEHSQLFPGSPELDGFLGETGALKGGVARRMALLQTERAAAQARGAATLTFSSGDFSQGSLASAAWIATSPELALMYRMGYDAVALGNHEFDLGPKALASAIAGAGAELPPLVLTNLNFSDTSAADDELKALYDLGKIAPHRIVNTSNGLRIGVIASMGVAAGTVAGSAPPVTFWSGATNADKFANYAARLQAAANTLRAQGVDAVILLAHGGIGATAGTPAEDELLGLQLSGVDLILSGHSHLFTPQPRIMYGSGKTVPVVQAKPYGQNVGKVELVFRDDGEAPRPYLDPAATEFIEVDDTIAPTTDVAFITDLQTRTIGFLEFGLDGIGSTALPSFLESTLSKVTGAPVTADPLEPGSLWNMPLGLLDYEVVGMAPGETNAMNLDTDAMLAAVRGAALIGLPPGACASCASTELAFQASGPIRGDLKPGTTGAVAFGDVYHVVPLGGDPTAVAPADMNPATNPAGVQAYLNAVPGYPLVKVNIPTAALKAALEGTLATGLFVNGDFFPGVSGLEVEYGLAPNPASPVAVKFMALADGTVLYDAADPAYAGTGGYAVSPTSFRSLATTFYVAAVAQGLGIPMFDDVGTPLTTPAQLAPRVVRRGDGSAIKDYEALAQFIAAASAGNGGLFPAGYGGAVPVRTVCTGPGCPAGY